MLRLFHSFNCLNFREKPDVSVNVLKGAYFLMTVSFRSSSLPSVLHTTDISTFAFGMTIDISFKVA